MESILPFAIQAAQQCEHVYTKFISANDVGKTSHASSRSHQSGFYISRSFLHVVFEQEIKNDTDLELFATIKWQNDFETASRFKYYGSKNECHLTRLGKGFPFRTDDNIGDLFILCKKEREYYLAFILSSDEEIEDFFAALNISGTETDRPLTKQKSLKAGEKLITCYNQFIESFPSGFPPTSEISNQARKCFNDAYKIGPKQITAQPDKYLLSWLDAEYQLFKAIENDRYSARIKTPFSSVEELVECGNTILNRRKSRAGKSLEHHLHEIFTLNGITFSTQAKTERNKKPDFLFPGQEAYHNKKFNEEKLTMLASKTTCKDRWTQILNEADRIKVKHLFTLQQGISENQLEEMRKNHVQLVVPKSYLKSFPKKYSPQIMSLEDFLAHLKSK